MAERRPLSAGVLSVPDADPDMVRSFVKQEPPAAEPAPASPAPEDKPPALRIAPPVEAKPPPPPRAGKKRRGAGIVPVAPVPVTVRLRPEVAGGLKRASLERQLNGEDVFTQQNLVETLLEPWLREHGYLE